MKFNKDNYKEAKGMEFTLVLRSARYRVYVADVDMDKGYTIKRYHSTGDDNKDIMCCLIIHRRTTLTEQELLDDLNQMASGENYNINDIGAVAPAGSMSDSCPF